MLTLIAGIIMVWLGSNFCNIGRSMKISQNHIETKAMRTASEYHMPLIEIVFVPLSSFLLKIYFKNINTYSGGRTKILNRSKFT